MRAWCRTIIPGFACLPAREAVEIGLRAASKGHAVERLMKQAAFHGRKPIYVGDDFTDEAGISAARSWAAWVCAWAKSSAAIPRMCAPG